MSNGGIHRGPRGCLAIRRQDLSQGVVYGIGQVGLRGIAKQAHEV